MASLPGTPNYSQPMTGEVWSHGSLPTQGAKSRTAVMWECTPRLSEGLCELLVQQGYQIETVESAREALQVLGAKGNETTIFVAGTTAHPHLPALIEQIKLLPVRPNIPVLVVVSTCEKESLNLALRAGADEYIEAPLQPAEASFRLKKLQQAHAMKQELRRRTLSIRREFETAQRLQRSMLPRGPVSRKGVEVSWSYEPYGYIAGDMFNVFSLDEEIHGIYVADVCGHGAAAAMISVWIAHTLQPPQSPSEDGAKRTSDALHAMLLHPAYTCAFLESQLAEMQHELYFTLFYALVDTSMRQMRYTRCGHPHPILLTRDGNVSLLQGGDGPAIGMGLGLPFSDGMMEYQPGDRVFFYSDGLIEAMSPEGKSFGIERCLQHIKKTRHLTVEEQKASLLDTVRQFQKRQRFEDDLTLLGIDLT